MEPLFLTLDEVLEIHRQQIDRYGGAPGIRDQGTLESALAQPLTSFDGHYLHASIPANAAITFLLLNDWDPVLDEDELEARCRPFP